MRADNLISDYEQINESEISDALKRCINQVRKNIEVFYGKFPAASSERGIYKQTENDDWTNGFWTGELWLAYEHTKEEAFKRAALHQVSGFKERMIKRIVVDHHDMGFLYTPSCVAAYKLTGDKTAKEAALMAADNLLLRFQEKGEFFQAWGRLGDKENYRLIIDCLLNMPLLFWASEVTKEEKYKAQAIRHIKTSMKYVIRDDASTYHTYFFDTETGSPLKGVTAQGYRDGSIWARGQAWGIYGSAVSYRYLKDSAYIDSFEKVTDCFLKHLPDDLIPYWDFDFTDGSSEPRDSSAAAIAVCGMLEMAKHLNREKADYYIKIAKCLLKALTIKCLYKDGDNTNGILLHGTYAKKSPYNSVADSGVDECNLWGDYFYMEALIRMSCDWNVYW